MLTEAAIAVLLIEDNPGDARLIEKMLVEAKRIQFKVTWRDNLASGLEYLDNENVDVILLDLGLPGSTGLDTVAVFFSQTSKVPVLIVLSGLADEIIALHAVQLGAQDYLIKGQVGSALLVRSIRYAIERSQAEEALQQAHDQLERRVKERTVELASTVEALLAEIAERKQAEDRIRYMAQHDALSGLPNRTLLQDRLRQMVAHAQRNHSQVAVLFIDLDDFKAINDSLGHYVGDIVLQFISRRLQKCLREVDSVARLGGDEFVLILTLHNDSTDAARVAQKALATLAQPIIVEGHELHVTGSIGISLYPDDGITVESLMRTADTAMYHAKETGRGNYQFFTPALNHAAQQRLIMGTRLRQALAQNEFVLHYQPQVNIETGIVFSTEALLRWQPPGAEPMSCAAFITSAEESGLIVPLGEWALRQACRQLRSWRDEGYPELKIAVNLSPRQLAQENFCSLVEDVIAETGIPASALELEITESTLMQRGEFALVTLRRLRDMGIQLSVDDFGTGYSSLAYLQRFPVHTLKVDQSFVRGIGTSRCDTALVTAIIAMAHSLQLGVIAEGVENLQQAQFLLSQDCSLAQGFYYSEAVPARIFSEHLHKPWP